MEIECVEKCFVTIIWGFLQSLMSLVADDSMDSNSKIYSELGIVGDMIVAGR